MLVTSGVVFCKRKECRISKFITGTNEIAFSLSLALTNYRERINFIELQKSASSDITSAKSFEKGFEIVNYSTV